MRAPASTALSHAAAKLSAPGLLRNVYIALVLVPTESDAILTQPLAARLSMNTRCFRSVMPFQRLVARGTGVNSRLGPRMTSSSGEKMTADDGGVIFLVIRAR